MGGKGIKIVLFFIVLIGLVLFAARSGIVGKLESTISVLLRPFSSSTLSASTTQQGGFSQTQQASASVPWYEQPSPSPAPSSPSEPWYGQQGTTGTSSINPSDVPHVPQGYALNQLSPYFRKVRLGSVSAGSGYSIGQISIYANLNRSEAVDVTGWTIAAHQGSDIVPQAVGLYDPSGLAANGDIVLRSGDYVNIYASASAIGENLRLNKCAGYLENYNNFVPSLPRDCPSIDRSDIVGFSGECQNYIQSLSGCRLPDSNQPVPQNDYGCINYLTTINFRGCYDRHLGDADFLSHEWRVWTSHKFLDQYHDQLRLLDKNGLLVDLYEY